MTGRPKRKTSGRSAPKSSVAQFRARSSKKPPAPAVESDPKSAEKPSNEFPIVGIGASAGGLEAFQNLLSHLPAKTGMAFVLVQHLDPKRESMLREILARSTPMPVREVRNGMTVERNSVYVVPATGDIGLIDGSFQVVARKRVGGREMPIDAFFRSLAESYMGLAIGVVLSGTLSDGALGLRAIKAEGGVTFAQEEGSAKFPDMPRAAIAAGSVDFVFPPEKIAQELARIGKHPYARSTVVAAAEQGVAHGSDHQRILSILRSTTGVDFSHYRQTTVKRRISRRWLCGRSTV